MFTINSSRGTFTCTWFWGGSSMTVCSKAGKSFRKVPMSFFKEPVSGQMNPKMVLPSLWCVLTLSVFLSLVIYFRESGQLSWRCLIMAIFQVFCHLKWFYLKKSWSVNVDIISRLWGRGWWTFSSPRAAQWPLFFRSTLGSLLLLNPDHCSLHLDSKHGATTVADAPGPAADTAPFGPPWG